MKYIITLGTFLILLMGTPSCKKDTMVKTDIKKLWDCNASQHFDSAKLADKLIGSWQWTETSSEKSTKQADKKVIVTFTSAGKFSVTENSTVLTQGNWQLKIEDGDMFGLSVDTASQFLYGRILLCDNHVLFNDSYKDGADNLFTRTK